MSKTKQLSKAKPSSSESESMSEGEYGQWSDADCSSQSDQDTTTTGTTAKNTATKKDQASVFSELLNQRSAADPVLARRPKLLAAPQEAALERRALAILRKEKRGRLAKLRQRPDPVADQARERALKRVATRGAVHLFNAVHKHQSAKDANTEKQRSSTQKNNKHSKQAKEAPAKTDNNSKVDFMELLKTGPAKII